MPVVILAFVFLASSIIADIKQNDKFTKVIVTSFLLIFVYYFFTNLMNTLGSNSKLPLNWAEILAQEDTWVYLFVQMHFENHPGFSIYWSESFIKEVKKEIIPEPVIEEVIEPEVKTDPPELESAPKAIPFDILDGFEGNGEDLGWKEEGLPYF